MKHRSSGSGPGLALRSRLAPWRTRPPWVCTTPLGSAVDPEVCTMTIGSLGRTSASTCSRKASSTGPVGRRAGGQREVGRPRRPAGRGGGDLAQVGHLREVERAGPGVGETGDRGCRELGEVGAEHRRRDHEQRHVGVAHRPASLGRLHRGREGHEHRPDPGGRQPAHHPFGGEGVEHRDLGALAHSAGEHLLRHLAGCRFGAREREAPIGHHHEVARRRSARPRRGAPRGWWRDGRAGGSSMGRFYQPGVGACAGSS